MALTRRTSLVAALAALTMGSPLAVAEPVVLAATPVKGAEARYTCVLDAHQSVYGEDQEKPNTEKKGVQEYGVLVRITDVTDTGATAELVYESIKFSIESPMGPMTFDSTAAAPKEQESILAPILKPMVGAKVMLEIDKSGGIRSVRIDPKTRGQPGARALDRLLDENSVRMIFGPLFALKDGPADTEQHDPWLTTFPLSGAQTGAAPGELDQRRRLEKLEGGIARVTLEGSLRTDPKAQPVMPGMTMTGSQTGWFDWDTAAGRLAGMEIEETAEVTFEYEGKPVRSKTVTKTTFRPRP